MSDFAICRRVPLGTKASIVGLLDRESGEFFAPDDNWQFTDLDNFKKQVWLISGSMRGLLHRMEVEPKTSIKKDRTGWLVTHQGQHHHRNSFEEAVGLGLSLIKGAQTW